ncbi:U1 snRNP protein [Elasticomyces elasticus]|nr:U1 snRNP protein [Elasticomyces elasticus]KAK4999649.1 U1 snRNP protein [Elasticomyces elasticus]
MNGAADPAAAAAAWTTHYKDDRPYYYNTVTKQTQWDKPVELMTQVERNVAVWKEYATPEGRKYWHNKETKTTTWDMPPALRDAATQSQPLPTPQRPAVPEFVAGGSLNRSSVNTGRDNFRNRSDHNLPDRPAFDSRDQREHRQTYGERDGFRPSAVPTREDNEYSSFEEAQAAFLKLLKRTGVQYDWTWEQAMNATIKDPQYRALKNPTERRAAFEKYRVEIQAQEKERAKERLIKLKQDFGAMLRSHPEIKHYSRWKTIRPILEGETVFRATSNEDERRQLFDEYVTELKRANTEKQVNTRKAAMDELISILRGLNLEPYTRWSEAQATINENERFAQDEKFRSLSKSDILAAFEGHVKTLERVFVDTKAAERNSRTRRERQSRDAFAKLLQDLKREGKITADTKWKDLRPLVADDPRYHAMLGTRGSSVIDLFWDMIEDEARRIRHKREMVLDLAEASVTSHSSDCVSSVTDIFVQKAHFTFDLDTSEEAIKALTNTDAQTAGWSDSDISLVLARIKEKVSKVLDEERREAEHRQRRKVDALRSRIRHLEPPVHLDDSWDRVRVRIETTKEYLDLENDELRKTAFDKVVKRLKEKEEENALERERREQERSVRKQREREREQRHTRTPEVDPYEADRRKAIADRERNYKKTSMGISPPRDRRNRGDHYESDRRDRQVSMSIYDRERRDREIERERQYVSRADPRDKGRELDYGDGGEGASVAGSKAGDLRKRKNSDASAVSKRDPKRVRREATPRERNYSHHRSKTPAAPVLPKEDEPALQSGSEEGEIEEI